jgi:hypothetical protein
MKHIRLYEEFKELGLGTEATYQNNTLVIKQNDGMTTSVVRLNKEETNKMLDMLSKTGVYGRTPIRLGH